MPSSMPSPKPSTDGYLNQWWFWLVLIIMFIIIIYIYTRITGNGIRENTPTDATSVSDISQVESNTLQNYDEIDLTPVLPRHIPEDQSYSQKKQSKGEAECLRVLTNIYKVPFDVQVRPDWLRNPRTNRRLELDISELKHLKIAVEYNGRQHYIYTKKWHKTLEDFKQQVYRDTVKYELCQKHGVYLITVPYNVPISQIHAFIVYHLPESVKAREDLKAYNSID